MDWSIILWLVGTAIVTVAPMILVHELGHFLLAKLAGIRVEEFGFGYPPRLLKLWRGRGYLELDGVRVIIPPNFRSLPSRLSPGENVEVMASLREDGSYILRRLTPLVGALAGQPTPPMVREDGTVVMQGRLTAWEPGTLYSLNLLPLGGFVKMTGEEDPSDPRSLAAQPKRVRLAVLAAGALLNIFTAFLLLIGAYASGHPEKWVVKITTVEPGGAAEAAGLQPGDIVTAVDNERLEEGVRQFQTLVHSSPGKTLTLTIRRGRETLTIEATPRLQPEGHGLLGIVIAQWPDHTAIRYYPLHKAVLMAGAEMIFITGIAVLFPFLIIGGSVPIQEARPASVVGISGMLTFALQQSLDWGLAFPVLNMSALVSLALGLTNLLPIPALDGGRILFVLIEAIRGRRVSPQREAAFHMIGLVILISIVILVIMQDVINPIIPWSWLKR
ncbi:MAG: M50 family metallopeptidase [Anaerolineae bacterium]|nr:M50 family metallopeptidase [Anaerolineae bacterium]